VASTSGLEGDSADGNTTPALLLLLLACVSPLLLKRGHARSTSHFGDPCTMHPCNVDIAAMKSDDMNE
jgi:hypothetical protein